jgi:hypothetical protein
MTYQDWQQRVCPIEIPEEDRLRAKEEIKPDLNEPHGYSIDARS